jgi:hypothetical protein
MKPTEAGAARPQLTGSLTVYLARSVMILFFAALIGALIFRVGQYLVEAWLAINFPFELDWAEGLVWQQAVLIPGPRMYGPIDVPPFMVFPYPPLYSLAVHALAALGADPLIAGRALAVACTLVIAGLCGWLVNRAIRGAVGRPAHCVGTVVGTLVPLTYHPVTYWSQQMRVDMLAIALGFLGVALVVLAVRRQAFLWPAVAAFVLGVYTKQNEIAAPAAALIVALLVNCRQTVLAALAGLGMAAAALLALEWTTAGGFLWHIISYNINPFSLRVALDTIARIHLQHIVYFVSAVAGLLFLWRREVRHIRGTPKEESRDPPKLRVLASFTSDSDLRTVLVIITLWFILSSIMLVTSGKTGSNENYFIEVMCVWAIPIGMLVAFAVDRALAAVRTMNAGLACGVASLLAVALLVQVRYLWPHQYQLMHDPQFAAANERLVQEVRDATRPVYSENMVVLMRGGRGIAVSPPTMATILTISGQWDQTAFVRMIEDRNFAFLILRYENHYPPDMLSVIRRAYPTTEQIGPYIIRRPRA